MYTTTPIILSESNLRMLDCIIKENDLIDYAIKLGLSGVAITDHESVSSYIKALNYFDSLQKKALKVLEDEESSQEMIEWATRVKNFKLALGNEIYLCRDGLNAKNYEKGKDKYFHFILIAKDKIGNDQIRLLSSRAWARSFYQFIERVPTYYSDIEEIIGSNPGHVIASSACFRAGSLVTTKDGFKPVETITSDDYVLNRYGVYEKVNFPTHRNYQGRGKKIWIVGNPEPIICTENHQFLTISNANKTPRWREAKDLNFRTSSNKNILLLPVADKFNEEKVVLHKKDWKGYSLPEEERAVSNTNQFIKLKDDIEITPEIARLFGLFLGDGSISLKKSNDRIGFAFNYEEFDFYYPFVKKAGEQIGVEWTINRRPEHHRVDIGSGSRELVDLFYYVFGDVKADSKYVPDILKNLPKKLLMEVVFGYFLADGYFRLRNGSQKVKYQTGEFVSASISKQLTYDFYEILNRLHITSGISFSKGRIDKDGVNHKDSWYLTGSNFSLGSIIKKKDYSHSEVVDIFEKAIAEKESRDFFVVDGITYRKVRLKKFEDIEMNETVYCLNDNSHSFVCNGVVVHNCLGGQLANFINSGDFEKAKNFATWCSSIFGEDNFFLEFQPGEDEEQIKFNKLLCEFCKNNPEFKWIVSTDAHYLRQEDRPIHKAFLNSDGEGDRETDKFYATTYLMDEDEIRERLSYLPKDFVEQSLSNTNLIYNKIEQYSLKHKQIIPRIPLDFSSLGELTCNYRGYPYITKFFESEYEEDNYFIATIWKRAKEENLLDEPHLKRIEEECEEIWVVSEKIQERLSAYFTTMSKIIDIGWTKGDTLIGPWRGSVGGSLCAYLSGIIQRDPLKSPTPLYAWRFISRGRAELAD